jgi:excinuclease UvrABC helicase subunit UvrB
MINYASREINCKIVYYGPGLGGKTTNLEYVYGKVSPSTRGKLISLATETERKMKAAAKELDFMTAAQLRDELFALREKLKTV